MQRVYSAAVIVCAELPRAGMGEVGRAHEDYQRQFYKQTMGVGGPVQEMPRWGSRVEEDTVVKDYWGM